MAGRGRGVEDTPKKRCIFYDKETKTSFYTVWYIKKVTAPKNEYVSEDILV